MTQRRPFFRPRVMLAAILVGLLAACAARPPMFPEPLREPKPEPAAEELLQAEEAGRDRPRVEDGPPVAPAAVAPQVRAPSVPSIARREPVSLVLDGVPLATFINVVYNAELGFAIEIDQSIRQRPDLVSLHLTERTAPQEVYIIAAEVLRNYGVAVHPVGNMLRFAPPTTAGSLPEIVSARSSADIPQSQRPVFVAVPLDVSTPGSVAAQVRTVFGDQQGVSITEMVEANAVLIGGPPAGVQATMEAVQALDRATLVDKRSVRINPLYVSANVLADELRDVLTAQGFSVRSGPGSGGVLTIVPVASANALILFSESEQALEAAVGWAEQLDVPSDAGAGEGGVYLYAARHTTVETLLPVLQALVGGAPGQVQGNLGSPPDAGEAQGSAPNREVQVLSAPGVQMAVDPIRNVIVFQGEAQQWRAIQGVLARLDQPARQVVIEVTVAEVTLTDEFAHGIEWALRNVSLEGMAGPLTGLAGGAPSAGSVVWRALSGSGQVSAILNLFARDSRVSILSTPRLMVKSGENASIDVGTEVPIITQQATAPDLPQLTPSILQQIQYRKTGVLLDITPVVHSGQRVDLDVSLEVSEATPTDTSDISSPSIFSRRLATSLSLADGEGMLLGGLISSTNSDGKTKVPLLGDIPVIGRAFQNRRTTGGRTEMLMLITPYVVEDANQAREITDAIEERFGAGTRPRWPGAPLPGGG